MALFKIMKGGKDRLGSQSTHEGYAWFTTEDAGFYIDAAPINSSGTSTGDVVRKRINDASNTSFSESGMSSTNVHDAIVEVKKTLSYNSQNETLTLS